MTQNTIRLSHRIRRIVAALFLLIMGAAAPASLKAQIEVISNGYVGVGTVTPQAKLDLNGSWRWQPQGAHPLWLVRVADGNGNMETVDPATIFPQTQVDLSLSGTASPVTLHSSAGADITITAGPGISLSTNAGNLTITNTGDSNAGDDVTGSGTANYISKWSNPATLTNSIMYENNSSIGIGTTTPLSGSRLHLYAAGDALQVIESGARYAYIQAKAPTNNDYLLYDGDSDGWCFGCGGGLAPGKNYM